MKKKKKYLLVFLCSLLISCLAVVQFIAGDVPETIKGSITIQYTDFFTSITVKTLTTEDNLTLGEYEKTAPEVENHKVFGESKKTVTLTKDNPNQNITFFYYKEGEQMGTLQSKFVDETTGKEIATSTSQENVDLVNFKPSSEKTITFEGKSYTYTSHKISYENMTGSQVKAIVTYQYKPDEELKSGTVTSIFKDEKGRILAKNVQENVPLNTTSVDAGKVDNFKCISDPSVKISLTKDKPTATVEFTYEYKGETPLPDKIGVILKLKNKLTGEVFETQNQSIEWGKDVAVPSSNKDGYTLCDPDQTILLTLADATTKAEDRPIEVDYTPDIAKVTIHYQDVDGNKIADDDVMDKQKFGTQSYSAKTVAGHSPVEPSIQQVTFDVDSYEKEITFKYTIDVQTKPDETVYTVVTKYVDENNKEIKQAVTKTYNTSTVTVNADKIEGYTLADDESKSIHMTIANPSATVVFKYKKNSTPVTPPVEETQGTIVINYFLENSQTSVKDSETVKKDFGTQSFTAPEVGGYTVVGDTVKSVTISKESPNSSVTFYYKKVSEEKPNDKPEEKPSDKPEEKPNDKPSDEKFTSGKLVVHFVDSNGNKLLDDDIKTGLSDGTYSYYGKTISGYVLNGSNKITFIITKNNPSKEITYTYVKNTSNNGGSNLTILFVDDTTGESLLNSQVYSGINAGTYTYKANHINGYTVYGDDTQTINIGENTRGQITFRYRKNSEGVSENKEESTVNKQGSVVIKYIDKSTGKEIAPAKTFNNLEYKSYAYSAETIEGYEVSGSTEQSVTLSSSMKSMVITFEYNKTGDKKPVTKIDSSKKTSNATKVDVSDNNEDNKSSLDIKGIAVKVGIGLVILIVIGLIADLVKNNKKDNNHTDDFEL